MNGVEIDFRKPQHVTIGMPSDMVARAMDEWLYRAAPVAMTVRRAKTKGLTLLCMDLNENDMKGVLFASWLLQLANGRAKVDIKPL